MNTEKGFVITWSKNDRQDFVWFVRHPMLNNGEVRPIQRGDLEYYLNKCKIKVTKHLKNKV
jgi:hypothetical protein